LGAKFFRGRRNRRSGELLRQAKPDLTTGEEKCTLIYVDDSTSNATSLGIYQSFEEAKDVLQKSVVGAGVLHIFTEDNRVIYSETREV
jgi:hypothetical protein